jgi:protein TBF1
MAKRKRGDVADYSSPEEWQQQDQSASHPQAQHYGTESQALINSTFGSSGVQYASSSGDTTTGPIGAPHDASGANDLADAADPNQAWHASSSRYPDVSTYSQQPYFYQQTHPSTYNSPWPPAESSAYPSQPSSYSLSAPNTTMPYFPTHTTTTDQSETTTDALVPQPSFHNYASEIDASAQYAYVQNPGASSQSRGDASTKTPTFLYEDASMHLKIQSLPILENLVCQDLSITIVLVANSIRPPNLSTP